MSSKVYFIGVSENEAEAGICEKVGTLARESGLFSRVNAADKVVLKLHFGEAGNTGYVRPAYVAAIAGAVLERKGRPVVSDSNTLYRGRRMNSSDHLQLAHEHGFTPGALNAEIVIPDDTLKENIRDVELNGAYVKHAKVGALYRDANAIIGIAHFKGHLMTGFGGSLKNIGMGCATREGKLFQHSDLAPIVVIKACTGCRACLSVCPAGAIRMEHDAAVVDASKCIGCASCIAACKFNVIDLNWEGGGMLIQEKMVEYAKAVLFDKKEKAIFFNFLIKITRECDCIAKDDPRVVSDIGILASADPVAADQAGFDLVTARAGTDILKKMHPHRDGHKQLLYAEKIGLGSTEYELEMVG
jgi:uncharacterized protein